MYDLFIKTILLKQSFIVKKKLRKKEYGARLTRRDRILKICDCQRTRLDIKIWF